MGKKSVLMCCYYFPPFARSGGMRSLQFARHLAALGWSVEVLTADPSLYVSTGDPASTANGYEALESVKVTRVAPRSLVGRESRLREFAGTLTDPWRLEGNVIREWVRTATEAALAIVQKRPETVLYIGCQPYAAAAIGIELQRRAGTRWLVDLADPWTLDEGNQYSSVLHYKRQQASFRRVMRAADVVVANTPDARAAMAAFEPRAEAKLIVITFGYEPGNLPATQPQSLSIDHEFVMVHLGAIEVTGAASMRRNPLRHRPHDTDLAARGTHYLLTALAQVRDRRPELFAKLRVRVVSTRTENEFAAVQQRGMASHFEWTGMLTNDKALMEVSRAHVALLLQQGAPVGHRLRSVRAKTYEYMALGKPILACVPGGDGTDFIVRYGRGVSCNPADATAIADGLLRLFDDYRAISTAPIDRAFVEGFAWGPLARQLDKALTSLLA